MIFLTYNDSPGGIYQSQVIDVCRFWEDTFHEKTTLIAFISGRSFWANRKKLKQAYGHTVVLPMYPGITNWGKNLFMLRMAMLFRRRQHVIARGVFATLLARQVYKFEKVCFDARGAYTAEWSEYLKEQSSFLSNEMNKLEGNAVLQADSRIAVSSKLVDYWKEHFRYSFLSHAIIPCTLASTLNIGYDATRAATIRQQLGVNENETLLVYSGSLAKWQSLQVLGEALTKALSENPLLKVLMLCKEGGEKEPAKKFPGRVMQKWVAENEVQTYLQAADYGLLVRENSVTNRVSSPVKFAEYMAAGLPVIISENIGDSSAFVQQHNCGMLVSKTNWATLTRPAAEEKQRIQSIAEQYFRKKHYTEEYRKLF